MLIKFSKQIASTFAKVITGYKCEFKALSNIRDGVFSASCYWLQRWTQNVAKHLRWSFLEKQSKTRSRSLFLKIQRAKRTSKQLNVNTHKLSNLTLRSQMLAQNIYSKHIFQNMYHVDLNFTYGVESSFCTPYTYFVFHCTCCFMSS